MNNPDNLPDKEKSSEIENIDKQDAIIRHLDDETQKDITETQKSIVKDYMKKMRFGILGVTAITCKAEKCSYYSNCPLVAAQIPLPKGEQCPVEIDLQQQWLENFVNASGIQLELLSAYDMLLLNDLAYQQVLESRAAMELADNPQIQVKTYIGKDPVNGNPMYTYSLNNLVTFREKSAKMKMKILQEMIATAKAKSTDRRTYKDKSTEVAERLRRIQDLLGKQAINTDTIEAEFKIKDE